MRRRGFTLFELCLVMAILVVLAAVAFPVFDAWQGEFRVEAAADSVRAAWARARSAAIDQGTAYRFGIVPGTGNYRIAPDSASSWAGGDAPPAPEGQSPPVVVEDVLPKGVRLTTSDAPDVAAADRPAGAVDPSQWVTAAVFLPDGTARDDVRLTLAASGARPLVLKLRGMTGAMTTERLPLGGHRP